MELFTHLAGITQKKTITKLQNLKDREGKWNRAQVFSITSTLACQLTSYHTNW